jgi:hypothetical protein
MAPVSAAPPSGSQPAQRVLPNPKPSDVILREPPRKPLSRHDLWRRPKDLLCEATSRLRCARVRPPVLPTRSFGRRHGSSHGTGLGGASLRKPTGSEGVAKPETERRHPEGAAAQTLERARPVAATEGSSVRSDKPAAVCTGSASRVAHKILRSRPRDRAPWVSARALPEWKRIRRSGFRPAGGRVTCPRREDSSVAGWYRGSAGAARAPSE